MPPPSLPPSPPCPRISCRFVLLTTATSLPLLREDTSRWFVGYAVRFIKSDPWLRDLISGARGKKKGGGEGRRRSTRCQKKIVRKHAASYIEQSNFRWRTDS